MTDVMERAQKSLGRSDSAVHRRVLQLVDQKLSAGLPAGFVVDVGCGAGGLSAALRKRFGRYAGVDVVRHEGFPEDAEFFQVNLDTGRIGLPDGCADLVVAAETIEHVENPRAFVRELCRITKPGGRILVSTPNQLSWLSKLTFLLKNRFTAFQERDYPAHITALLEIDLLRIFQECGLTDLELAYTHLGRIVFTSSHYPERVAKLFPRALSDNLLLMGTKS